jgi:hypothetical protein
MRNAKADGPKVPCQNWNSHDGPKGGKQNNKRKHEMVLLNTKKGKKARKQLQGSLELGDNKKSSRESESTVTLEEDDNHLYQLIHGVPTVLIVGEENALCDDYVPVRDKRCQLKMVGNEQVSSIEKKRMPLLLILFLSRILKRSSDYLENTRSFRGMNIPGAASRANTTFLI